MAPLASLAIRTLHVLAVATLFGGAVVAWGGYWTAALDDVTPARQYEWLFWAAFGVLVLTGVGNLGALGPPGPTTDWGRALLGKLLAVGGFVTASAVRTLLVVRAADATAPTDAVRRTLSRAYGLTAAALALVVVFAEVLAHG